MTRPFQLRAWQLHTDAARDHLAEATQRAIAEAPRYDITHFEFTNTALCLGNAYTIDPVPPCGSWVLCGQTFRDFPKLARHDVLHSQGAAASAAARAADLAYTRRLFGQVKAAGLKVMAWHHLRRDLPDELAAEYPQSVSGDVGFLCDWEEATITEFFELVPEVDALVVTSMTETPGVMHLPGRAERVERLAGVFAAMERACRRAGKTLIIRDWGAVGQNQEGGPVFQEAIARLPDDVCIHIKNVVLDFVTNAEVPHPNLHAYPGRPLIVEFEVYGEYFGRADVPYVDPGHFCGRLDALYALGPHGVTARITFEAPRKARRYESIFDSPNAANAVVFSRWASDAAKNRPVAEWLDFLAPPRRWQTYHWQWLADRYGEPAAPLLARVFERTPQIVHGIFAPMAFGQWHPFGVSEHTTLPWPPMRLEHHGSAPWNPPPDILETTAGLGDNDFSRIVGWMPKGTIIETVAWSQLLARKEEALRLARICAEEISREGPDKLSAADFEDLDLLMQQMVMVCRADVLTGRILAAARGPDVQPASGQRRSLPDLSGAAARLAAEIRRAYGDQFFGELPLRMETWSRWAEE